jgi:hypothetical protein
MKISIKFDNEGEGQARFSFKLWLEKENLEELPELYLLISNRENPVILEDIDEEYNQHLAEDKFRKAAGIDETKKEDGELSEKCMIETIKRSEEEDLVGRRLLNPRKAIIEETEPTGFPHEMSLHIAEGRDLLLKIEPCIDSNTIRKATENIPRTAIMELQFRIFLRNFLNEETLDDWFSSSQSWSVNIDIHKERNFGDIIYYFRNHLKYPENLDLWINIPSKHLFIASSPIYKNAIKLETEDIEYKTYERKGKKEYYENFETRVGDYSVRISNKEKPIEFSIICVSPFLPGEKPHELKERIIEFKRRSEELEKSQENTLREVEKSQKDILRSMVGIFGIFVAIFSFILISANSVLKIQLPEEGISFWQTFCQVLSLLLPVFIFLGLLLVVSVWATRK